jgi:hypothetical protein
MLALLHAAGDHAHTLPDHDGLEQRKSVVLPMTHTHLRDILGTVVEQREYRSMTPGIVGVNERSGAVTWTQGFVPDAISRIEVVGELIGRGYQCAKTAPLHCTGRCWGHGKTIHVLAKSTTTPKLLVSDQLTSPFDNLDFEWS